MSRSLNKVVLIGNAGSAPESRTTPGGTRIAKLPLATDRSWKDRDGREQESTEWHRLTFFGRLAEVVEAYVARGDLLFVEGSIHYSTSKHDDGSRGYWTDIRVERLIMLGPRRHEAAPATDREPSEAATDADLPF